LAESSEFNNASLSWGTIGIGVAGVGPDTSARATADTTSMAPAKAYNGKILPHTQGSARQVRISTTSQGRRRTEFLGADASDDGGPRVKAADSRRRSKLARARQQVIFPVSEMNPMPRGD
jgi:hypothetical protein